MHIIGFQLSFQKRLIAIYQILQCYNRHRRLCGRCKPGYYVSTKFLTFEYYKCDRNATILNHHRTLPLILLKYVPFTIFMLVIIFFNISLVNGPLNSYILFSQIVNSEGLYASGNITGLTEDGQQHFYSVYYFPYGLRNLNFFEVLIPKFCAFKIDTTIWIHSSLLPCSIVYPVLHYYFVAE